MSGANKFIILYLVLLFLIMLSACSPKVLPVLKMNDIPKEINLGDSVVFKWNASNAKSVFLQPGNDTLDTSGVYCIKPENDKSLSIRFIATDGKNKAYKSYSIKVLVPSIIAEVPASVTDEEVFDISWSAFNAESVTVNDSLKLYPVKGELKMKADTSGKVVFNAYNKFGKSAQKTLRYSVRYIEDFYFQEEIVTGDSSLIKWKFKNANKVWLDELDLVLNPIDSVYVKPLRNAVYHVNVQKNNGDTITKEVEINVIYPCLLSFFAPAYIFKNNDAVLKWNSRLLKVVSIDGVADSLPPNGKITVQPDKTTKYTLRAKVNGEEQSLTATVNVITRRFVVSSKSISQTPANMRFDFEIFATDFTYYPDSVKLYVLVVDTMGNFITDLAPPFGTVATSKKYFKEIVETTSSGKKHKVSSFTVREVHEKKDIPMDINLTLDYSGSMWGTTPKLEEAYRLFINKKPNATKLSMVRFSDTIVTLSELTADKNTLLTRSAFVEDKDTLFFGGTALYAAMDDGLSTLTGSKNQKQMMAFTDGYECSSFYYIGKKATFAQQVAKKAKKENIRINTIGYGPATNEKVLKFLAAITGGTYYAIYRPNDILRVMDECLYLHKNYYVITYKPTRFENERNITLTYNSNNSKTGTTNRDAFVGDKYNLQELESEEKNSYWNSPNKWGTKAAVSLPQSVTKFDFGKSDLKPGYEKRITPFIEYLKNNPSATVVIFGHTDHVGTEKDCDNLSRQRAQKIKDYMISQGVPETQIILEVCGKRFPIWKTEDKQWKAQENRRVELLIIE